MRQEAVIEKLQEPCAQAVSSNLPGLSSSSATLTLLLWHSFKDDAGVG